MSVRKFKWYDQHMKLWERDAELQHKNSVERQKAPRTIKRLKSDKYWRDGMSNAESSAEIDQPKAGLLKVVFATMANSPTRPVNIDSVVAEVYSTNPAFALALAKVQGTLALWTRRLLFQRALVHELQAQDNSVPGKWGPRSTVQMRAKARRELQQNQPVVKALAERAIDRAFKETSEWQASSVEGSRAKAVVSLLSDGAQTRPVLVEVAAKLIYRLVVVGYKRFVAEPLNLPSGGRHSDDHTNAPRSNPNRRVPLTTAELQTMYTRAMQGGLRGVRPVADSDKARFKASKLVGIDKKVINPEIDYAGTRGQGMDNMNKMGFHKAKPHSLAPGSAVFENDSMETMLLDQLLRKNISMHADAGGADCLFMDETTIKDKIYTGDVWMQRGTRRPFVVESGERNEQGSLLNMFLTCGVIGGKPFVHYRVYMPRPQSIKECAFSVPRGLPANVHDFIDGLVRKDDSDPPRPNFTDAEYAGLVNSVKEVEQNMRDSVAEAVLNFSVNEPTEMGINRLAKHEKALDIRVLEKQQTLVNDWLGDRRYTYDIKKEVHNSSGKVYEGKTCKVHGTIASTLDYLFGTSHSDLAGDTNDGHATKDNAKSSDRGLMHWVRGQRPENSERPLYLLMDNASSHMANTNVKQASRVSEIYPLLAGHHTNVVFLPARNHTFSPCERVFATMKQHLRRIPAEERGWNHGAYLQVMLLERIRELLTHAKFGETVIQHIKACKWRMDTPTPAPHTLEVASSREAYADMMDAQDSANTESAQHNRLCNIVDVVPTGADAPSQRGAKSDETYRRKALVCLTDKGQIAKVWQPEAGRWNVLSKHAVLFEQLSALSVKRNTQEEEYVSLQPHRKTSSQKAKEIATIRGPSNSQTYGLSYSFENNLAENLFRGFVYRPCTIENMNVINDLASKEVSAIYSNANVESRELDSDVFWSVFVNLQLNPDIGLPEYVLTDTGQVVLTWVVNNSAGQSVVHDDAMLDTEDNSEHYIVLVTKFRTKQRSLLGNMFPQVDMILNGRGGTSSVSMPDRLKSVTEDRFMLYTKKDYTPLAMTSACHIPIFTQTDSTMTPQSRGTKKEKQDVLNKKVRQDVLKRDAKKLSSTRKTDHVTKTAKREKIHRNATRTRLAQEEVDRVAQVAEEAKAEVARQAKLAETARVAKLAEETEARQKEATLAKEKEAKETEARVKKLAEQAETARVAAEQAETARVAAEQAETARVAAEQAETARVAAEKAETARVAAKEAETALKEETRQALLKRKGPEEVANVVPLRRSSRVSAAKSWQTELLKTITDTKQHIIQERAKVQKIEADIVSIQTTAPGISFLDTLITGEQKARDLGMKRSELLLGIEADNTKIVAAQDRLKKAKTEAGLPIHERKRPRITPQ